jgi:flavin-dependent dehydrogenase
VAGENGLRVALIDKKQAIPEVKRACGEVINVNEYSWGDYINFNARDGLLNFPVNGISVKYGGPHRNVYGMQTYSPGGTSIIMGDCREGRTRGDIARRGIAIDKSELLRGLLDEVRKYQVTVITGALIHRYEKKGEMVVVGDGRNTYESTFVIAADGLNSKAAQRLGFNREREFRGTLRCLFRYVADAEPPASDALIHIMGGKEGPALLGMCCTHRENEYWVAVDDFSYDADLNAGFESITRRPAFAPWFRKMKTIGTAACVGNLYSPIAEPFRDNVLLAGDAAFSPQISINGGIICGWKAANAVVLALLEGRRDREGVGNYLSWWKKDIVERHSLAGGNFMDSLDDSEADYLFSLFKRTLPATLDPFTAGKHMQEEMAAIMPVLKAERPELIQKLQAFQRQRGEELYAKRRALGCPNV